MFMSVNYVHIFGQEDGNLLGNYAELTPLDVEIYNLKQISVETLVDNSPSTCNFITT